MNQQVIAPPLPRVPQEVRAFAEERGVTEHVPRVLELTREAFPACPVAVSVGEDAELETHRYIALDVQVGGLDTEQLLAAQEAWSSGLSAVCPSHLAIHFVLGWQ